jgi:regulator of RNase E activity RraB
MSHFAGYVIDTGKQRDPKWRQYLDVLYPSGKDCERIKNRELLEVLKGHGDNLASARDVHHWIYFRSAADLAKFSAAALSLGYQTSKLITKDPSRCGVMLNRSQSCEENAIQDAAIELYRLARAYGGDYDGWETEVTANSSRAAEPNAAE